MTGEWTTRRSGSTVISYYVHMPGGAAAVYNTGGLNNYWHPDWLGTPRLYSSPTKTILADLAFGAYGELYQGPVVDGMFTGVAQVPEANDLRTFPARNLETVEGRWMSPDPAGFAAVDITNPQSFNRYAYVLGNPLGLVDPTGTTDQAPLNGAVFSTTVTACRWYQIFCWFNGGASAPDSAPPVPDNGSTLPITISFVGGGFPGGGTGGGGSAPTTTTTATPPKSTTARGSATCAASNASSFASFLGLPKDNFWAQAFLGNDFSTAANFLLGNDRGTNGRGALLSNPTPINATSIALSAIGKKVVANGGLVVKETPGGAPYAATKFLPIAETVGGKLLFKGIAAFSAVKLVYDGAAFGYAELQCGGIVQ